MSMIERLGNISEKDLMKPPSTPDAPLIRDEATLVKERVDQLNADYPGKLTTRVRIRHGVQAWEERGGVFPTEMEKGS